MKTATYIKDFNNYDDAFEFMVKKNIKLKDAGVKDFTYCVVPGSYDNYSVVDDWTAINLGLGYVISSSSTGWVANPWNKN